MNNAKSIIVTAVVTAMLILIMAGLALLKLYKALGLMIAIFALIGICNFAGAFFRWLSAKGELTLDPIVTEESEPEESYEELMKKFWSEA